MTSNTTPEPITIVRERITNAIHIYNDGVDTLRDALRDELRPFGVEITLSELLSHSSDEYYIHSIDTDDDMRELIASVRN